MSASDDTMAAPESAIPEDAANTAMGAASDETITIPPDAAITQLRELAWSAEEAPTVYDDRSAGASASFRW